jgi:hypothetical protein
MQRVLELAGWHKLFAKFAIVNMPRESELLPCFARSTG